MSLAQAVPVEKSTNVRTPTDAKPSQLARARARDRKIKWLRAGFGLLGPVAPGLAARMAERMFFSPDRHKAPEAEVTALARGHRFEIVTSTGTLAAWDWSSGREGARTVYLLHGWSGRAGQMTPFVQPLLDAGYDVIAFDAPGHGQSSGDRSSLVEFARALQVVVTRCGPAYAVIGHSMGGAAIALALHQGLKAQRVVFVGTPADPTEFSAEFKRELGVSDAVMREMQRRAEQRLGIAWSELGIQNMLKDAQVPLLLVHCEHDKEVDLSEAHRIAASWPGARVVATQGLGHRRILRDGNVARAIAEFVAQG